MLNIYITPQQFEQYPDFESFAVRYLTRGGGLPKETERGLEYRVHAAGQLMISRDWWNMVQLAGVETDYAILYVEIPIDDLQNEVPVEFPESSITSTDEEGNETTSQRTWEDYTIDTHRTVSVDGSKVLIQCGHTGVGATCGKPFTNDVLAAWISHFGWDNILTASEGVALMDGTSYPVTVV